MTISWAQTNLPNRQDGYDREQQNVQKGIVGYTNMYQPGVFIGRSRYLAGEPTVDSSRRIDFPYLS